MEYLIILGSQSDLAKEELVNFIDKKNGQVKSLGPNFALVETELGADKLIHNLGGSIKIAQLLWTLEKPESLTSEQIEKYLVLEGATSKVNFGFSLYDQNKKLFGFLQALFLETKKNIKNQGLHARLVSSKQNELSSVIVKKNKLLGREFIFVREEDRWHIGLTQAVQDFESYAFRDMERPERDDKSGMLPPKLAQIMLNLGGPARDKTILDPFCGSGTMLQEAALLGFDRIIGSDGNKRATDDTQKNIDWLKKHYQLKNKIEIRFIDVRRLADSISRQSIDLIVTEPYMGPARIIQRQHHIKELSPIKAELQELYTLAFKNFAQIIKPGGKVIFAFPIFKINEKILSVLDKDKITRFGFELVKPRFGSSLSQDHNLVYHRPDQKVLREITIWKAL